MNISLEVAERQLDRIQSFMPRIDARVSAMFAIVSAEIAIAAVNLQIDDFKDWWVTVPAVAFFFLAFFCVAYLYRCVHPNLVGGSNSLVFFGTVANMREAEYIHKMRSISEDDYLTDVLCQVWRNSEIVAEKYRHLKMAGIAIVSSLIPWTILLLALSIGKWSLPLISK
jgi:hypothetical protein